MLLRVAHRIARIPDILFHLFNFSWTLEIFRYFRENRHDKLLLSYTIWDFSFYRRTMSNKVFAFCHFYANSSNILGIFKVYVHKSCKIFTANIYNNYEDYWHCTYYAIVLITASTYQLIRCKYHLLRTTVTRLKKFDTMKMKPDLKNASM